MSGAVGMMDEAYFVGRREIIEWINGLLQLNITKIEETASGCVALQLMDICYPGQVSLHKVNWGARNDYEFVQNYKLLQSAFEKFHVDKHIPVDKIVRAKYQDNLEFMQWFKRYVEMTGPTEAYDPVAARSRCKGAATAGGAGARTTKPATQRKDSAVARVAAPRTTVATTKTTAKTTSAAARGASGGANGDVLAQALGELSEARAAHEALERERDFYFEKLRDVEVYLQSKQEQETPWEGCADIFKILYASTEDCVAVTEDGKVLLGEDARAYKEGVGQEPIELDAPIEAQVAQPLEQMPVVPIVMAHAVPIEDFVS